MRAYLLGGLVVLGVVLTAGTALAHHSFAAEFDANKPVKLTDKVTKVEWTNPHVWFYFNVKDEKTGEVTNWGAEMGPPHGLQRSGQPCSPQNRVSVWIGLAELRQVKDVCAHLTESSRYQAPPEGLFLSKRPRL